MDDVMLHRIQSNPTLFLSYFPLTLEIYKQKLPHPPIVSVDKDMISSGTSGASTAASGSGQITSAGSLTTPSPTTSPNSARSLFSGYVLGAIVVGCVTAALSL
ncbi:hypothetical protein C8R44DRAFT_973006 [Mycena epipterygia]|nr:hypothetical protein C8R44DRAFT_973006 [Mycena epipterygia]